MSNTIDERVVEMRFDNKDFEKNVKTTMSSLKELDKNLRLKDASKGLDNVDKAARKVDMTHLGKAVETVHAKFSALEVMGVTALANITNSAVNAGKRIASALTIDPIRTGLSEYETQINAVQTILANTKSKGSTLTDVNRALDELNKYADQTIYNFTEMTRNIGTFTAAGVDLDKSVASIKGIANLAAVSGSNAQQASTAMYQLSQALAAGKVSLMDWNSVVNAGMGGELFQNALIRTSELLKTGAKNAIKTYGTFRESLTKGEWLTTEVLTETLKQLSGSYTEAELIAQGFTKEQAAEITDLAKTATDAATKIKTFTQLWDALKETAQSGWTQTWELLIGDFEEAKALFTPLFETFSGFINKMSDARNTLLKGALGSPFSNLKEKIAGVLDTTKQTVEGVEALNGVVDKVIKGEYGVGQARIEALTKAGYDWARIQNLVNIKMGSSVRHTEAMAKATEAAANSTEALTDAKLIELGLSEEEITVYRDLEAQSKATGKSMEELLNSMEDGLSGRELLIDSFKNIGEAIAKPFKLIKEAWDNIFTDKFDSNDLYNLIEGFHELTESLTINGEAAENFKKVFEGIFAAFSLVKSAISISLVPMLKIAGAVLSLFGTNLLEVAAGIADCIVKFKEWVDTNTFFIGWVDKAAQVLYALINGIKKCVNAFLSLDIVKQTIENVKNTITDLFNTIAGGFHGLSPTGIVETISDIFNKIEAFIKGLNNSENIGRDVINGLVNGLKSGAQAVFNAIVNIGTTLLNTLRNILGVESPSWKAFDIAMDFIRGAVNGIKEGALLLWSGIKTLGSKLLEVTTDIFSKVAYVVNRIDFGKVFSLSLLASIAYVAKKIYDTVNVFQDAADGIGKLAKGIGRAFSGVGGVLDAFADKLRGNKWDRICNNLFTIAKSIAVLAASLYIISKIDPNRLWPAIGALAALSGVLLGLTFITSRLDPKGDADLLKMAAMLVGLGASLWLFASAIKKMEFLNSSNFTYVLGGLGAIITGITTILLTLGLMLKGDVASNIDKASALIFKMAWMMLTMALVMKIASNLDPSDIIKGAVVMGVFAGFVAALMLTTKLAGPQIEHAGKTIKQIASAMLLMAILVKVLSMMEPETFFKGYACMVALGLLIAGLMWTTKLAGPNAVKVGGTLLAISGAMALMALVVKMVANLDPGEITKGLVCITLFGTLIANFVILLTYLGGTQVAKVGSTMLMISVAIGILAAVAVALSFINIADLTKGLVAVGLLGSLVAGLIQITGKGQSLDKAMFIGMSIAIGVMAAAAIALSFIDTAALAKATLALSALMGMFAVMVAASKGAAASIGPLIVMTGAIAIMAGAIYILSTLPNMDAALNASASLAMVMISLAATMKVISSIAKADPVGMLVGLIGMAALMAEMYIIVDVLRRMDGLQNAGANAMALSVFVLALSVALLATAAVGAIYMATVGIAATGLLGMAALMAEMYIIVDVLRRMDGLQNAEANITLLTSLLNTLTATLVVLALVGPLASVGVVAMAKLELLIAATVAFAAGLGALTKEGDTIDKGLALIEKVALSIGTTFGNIIKGFTTAIASGLPEIGQYIHDFITNISVDNDVIKGAKSTGEAMKTLASAWAAITGAAILDIGDNNLVEFGNQLDLFGNSLSNFALDVKDVKPSKIRAAADAALTLAEVANEIPFDVGHNNLSNFGKQLDSFGNHLGNFATDIKDVKPNVIKSSAKAVKDLAEAYSEIPFDWNHNELLNFGNQLASFGPKLKEFSDSVDLVKPDIIKAAAKVTKDLAKAYSEIPSDWNHNELLNFGNQLASFGPKLKEFSESVNGVEPDIIKAAATATKDLAKAYSEIPSDWNHNELKEFGNQIAPLGEDLKAFSDNVSNIIPENITAAADTSSKLATMVSDLSGVTINATNVDTFTSKLGSIGNAIGLFATSISGITNIEDLTTAAKASTELGNALGTLLSGTSSNMRVSPMFTNTTNSTNNLSALTEQLMNLGSGVKAFADATIGINTDEATKAATTASELMGAIKTITANLENEDGESSIAAFSAIDFTGLKTKITEFASVINAFATGVTGENGVSLDSAAIDGFISSGEKIVAAAKTISADFESIDLSSTETVNEQEVNSFVNTLKTFGNGIWTFANEFKNIQLDAASMDANVSAASKMIDAIKDIDGTFEEASVDGLQEKASALGAALKSFGADITDDDLGKIDRTKAALEKINDITPPDSAKIDAIEESLRDLSLIVKDVTAFNSTAVSTFNTNLSNLSTGAVTEFVKAFEVPNTTATEAVNGFISSVATTISSYATSGSVIYTAFYNAGKYCVEGFAAGITDNTWKVEAKAKAMAKAAENAANAELDVNSPSKKFMKTGSSVVEGFVKGISNNLGDVDKSGRSLATSVLDATQDELDINSPSIVFKEEVGRYIVQGVAEGIKSDMSAEEAAEKKAQNIVSAFQKEIDKYDLDIETANKEYDLWETTDGLHATDEVIDAKKIKLAEDNIERLKGKVKLAYGEWQEMVANFGKNSEQAQSSWNKYIDAELAKAQEYVKISDIKAEAFDKEEKALDRAVDLNNKELEYWQSTTEGIQATDDERFAKLLETSKKNIEILEDNEQNAFDKWKHMVDEFGETSEEAQDAWVEYRDAQIEKANEWRHIANLQQDALDARNEVLNTEIEINEKEIDLYESMAKRGDMSKTFADRASRASLQENYERAVEKEANAEQAWINAANEYGSYDHPEVRKLYNAFMAESQAKYDALDAIDDYREKANNKIIDAIDRQLDINATELELWEAMYGNTATDAQRDSKYFAMYKRELAIRTEKTNELKRQLDALTEGTEAYNNKYDEWRQALVDQYKASQTIVEYEKSVLERQRNEIEERYDLASENANLLYDLWEKTAGRDASKTEKNTKKLTILGEQLTIQINGIKLAQVEYNEAIKEYGKNSNEAVSAYNTLLNKQLELANLQSEIDDINKDNEDRQKNALSEYKKYLKNYEKYYLDHGMTMEELDNDAKLVSGYDEDYYKKTDNSLNAIVESTKEALKAISSESAYGEISTGAIELGRKYLEATGIGIEEESENMIEGAAMVLTTCATTLGNPESETYKEYTTLGTNLITGFSTGIKNSTETVINQLTALNSESIIALRQKRPMWIDVGLYLVDGLACGIESGRSGAIRAAVDVALDALEAAKDVLDINSPSREFFKIGEYAVLGLANGLRECSYISEQASEDVGNNALNNLNSIIRNMYDIITSDMDFQPTIRPVLDLSGVEAEAVKLNTMFSRQQAMQINSSMTSRGISGSQNRSNDPVAGNTYQFTQNNYSPKALSSSEIYRQTNNQFSRFKRAVKI